VHVLDPWRDALRALSVILAVAGFLVYLWQRLSGEVRPHPPSWFLFGGLSVLNAAVSIMLLARRCALGQHPAQRQD
jgi:hypothetical protein